MERRNTDQLRHALIEIARRDGGSRLAVDELSDHDLRDLIDNADRHRVGELTLRVLAETPKLSSTTMAHRSHRHSR